MPELPEVETIRTGLKPKIEAQEIENVKILSPSSLQASEQDISQNVIGSEIVKLNRRGKVLILELSSGYALAFHLKMTGQVVYRSKDYNFGGGHPTESLIQELPDKSTRVIIKLKGGGRIFFNDQRKFGWIKLIKTGQYENLVKNMGPDMHSDVDITIFLDRLERKKNSKIKQVLLDQSVVAGIGNIYADESLFLSSIHPESRVGAIPKAKLEGLFKNIKEVLQKSIDMGGSSSRNYVNASGGRGNYLNEALVYGRKDQNCKNCNCEISKIRSAGRGTHICINCQRLYK